MKASRIRLRPSKRRFAPIRGRMGLPIIAPRAMPSDPYDCLTMRLLHNLPPPSEKRVIGFDVDAAKAPALAWALATRSAFYAVGAESTASV